MTSQCGWSVVPGMVVSKDASNIRIPSFHSIGRVLNLIYLYLFIYHLSRYIFLLYYLNDMLQRLDDILPSRPLKLHTIDVK